MQQTRRTSQTLALKALLLSVLLVIVSGQAEARHSLPGAGHVLFLDFDSQAITSMSFGVGVTLTSTIPPFDLRRPTEHTLRRGDCGDPGNLGTRR
jgi:hypothetical protein